MADRVSGRGKIIVAVLVVVLVAAAVWFALGRDDLTSTPVEDAVAGREITPGVADPGLTAEPSRPQGREAPDSNEGRFGAGAPTTTRDTPALNPGRNGAIGNTTASGTGRNAPPGPMQETQDAPTGSLRAGPNADPERSNDPGRQ